MLQEKMRTNLAEAAAQVAADTTRVPHGNAVPAEQAAKSKATALKIKFSSLSTLGGLEVLARIHTHTHTHTHIAYCNIM